MKCKVTMAAAAFAVIAAAVGLSGPAEAGSCQMVRAKGFAGSLSKATLYAQADLKQTAKAMKSRIKSVTTNCQKVMGGNYYCKIDAVVCRK
jgi:hypothetical protein